MLSNEQYSIITKLFDVSKRPMPSTNPWGSILSRYGDLMEEASMFHPRHDKERGRIYPLTALEYSSTRTEYVANTFSEEGDFHGFVEDIARIWSVILASRDNFLDLARHYEALCLAIEGLATMHPRYSRVFRDMSA